MTSVRFMNKEYVIVRALHYRSLKYQSLIDSFLDFFIPTYHSAKNDLMKFYVGTVIIPEKISKNFVGKRLRLKIEVLAD